MMLPHPLLDEVEKLVALIKHQLHQGAAGEHEHRSNSWSGMVASSGA